ncbi:extracellular solute-binding protein [Mesorhizobium sp. CA15]|uniref:extracellular solute-binding protein n=1 Tax=Mesorhizobium sp. CA15 TaxID=2876641 RepID=UPI001CD078B0|nr:extracellular solute-binding protein [Mesorhizobium sp. CA15]MBZ9864245.1 extracellular solute-binding protein [Mesorhizobium sp. CA15]
MKTTKSPATQQSRAPRLSRRKLLKSVAGLSAISLGAPAYVRNAFSSSGELNVLLWADQFPDPIIPNFERTTGIKINQFPFSQNEEQIYKLQPTRNESYDLCQPTRNRAPEFKDLNLLAPFDTSRLNSLSALIPSIFEGSKNLWTWDGELYHVPHCWGTEAISYRTDLYSGNLGNLSYGSLWEEGVKGHLQGRAHSMLLGIGLWWDDTGQMPSGRMLDGYVDEASFRKVWDPILDFAISHKVWIKQFCNSSEMTKSGLIENDVWIGQTSDRPSLSVKNAGQPVNFTSPKEGALAWVDGLALTTAARNIEQAYEFINYLTTPEVAAQVADGAGYNPVVAGFEAHASPTFRKNYQDTFPGDALKKIWLWPAEPLWYRNIRSDYVTKFKEGINEG